MFNKEWVYKNEDSLKLSKLPYFVNDPLTNTMVEMTNCTPERRKQLGWYDIVFINNQGNRANTFYEDVTALSYNQTLDRVECHAYKLKDNWRELIYLALEEKVKSYSVYHDNKTNIDLLLNKIQQYFYNEKYDSNQLIPYFNILHANVHDLLTFANLQQYTNLENIKLYEFVYPNGDVFKQKEHLTKYISQNLDLFRGKSIALTGVGCYAEAVLFQKHNISCTIVDNVFYNFGSGIFYISVAGIMTAIINDVYVNVIEEEFYNFSENEVVIMSGAFDVECAEKNWNTALNLKAKGKQILICSPSIWSGTNATINVPQSQLESIFEYNGDVVFSPQA